MEIINLNKILLKEIIKEVNENQKIPICIVKVNVELSGETSFTGTVTCSEPQRVWDLPLEVTLKNNIYCWNLADNLATGYFVNSNSA